MTPEGRQERVLLIGLARSPGEVPEAEASLDELALLAETAGAEAAGRILQVRESPDPATYIGKGKAHDAIRQARALKADAIVFDDELAPAQGRNLEDLAGVNPLAPRSLKIIDRTGLILDVFSQHAHSAEGKLQVELAQLSYHLPRLRGWGEVMSRLGGGIGTRGPGETKLESDRRRINRRLAKLKADLKDLERTRQVKRRRRVRSGTAQISLVGYTNSGKSTLLNALTGAGVLVQDRLFSTLDPTARRLSLPGGREAVLTDTVGFVKKLPHQLVEAFRSTLEETKDATLLLHVVDASHPHPEAQIEAVQAVLSEIGAGEVPPVMALNKADLISPARRAALARRFPDAIFVSALRSEGLDEMLGAVLRAMPGRQAVVTFKVPLSRGDVRSILYGEGEVLSEEATGSATILEVKGEPALVRRFAEFVAGSGPADLDP